MTAGIVNGILTRNAVGCSNVTTSVRIKHQRMMLLVQQRAESSHALPGQKVTFGTRRWHHPQQLQRVITNVNCLMNLEIGLDAGNHEDVAIQH